METESPITITLDRSVASGCGGPALQPGSRLGFGESSQQPTPSLFAAYGVLQHFAVAGQRTWHVGQQESSPALSVVQTTGQRSGGAGLGVMG